MEDAKGEGVRKQLPARRHNMIDGNISSWCLVLISSEGVELIRQTNELAEVLGELEEDCLQDKEEKQRKALEEKKEKQNAKKRRGRKSCKNEKKR
eukprot:3390963-Ditylum_brightwellii.AAC.1